MCAIPPKIVRRVRTIAASARNCAETPFVLVRKRAPPATAIAAAVHHRAAMKHATQPRRAKAVRRIAAYAPPDAATDSAIRERTVITVQPIVGNYLRFVAMQFAIEQKVVRIVPRIVARASILQPAVSPARVSSAMAALTHAEIVSAVVRRHVVPAPRIAVHAYPNVAMAPACPMKLQLAQPTVFLRVLVALMACVTAAKRV